MALGTGPAAGPTAVCAEYGTRERGLGWWPIVPWVVFIALVATGWAVGALRWGTPAGPASGPAVWFWPVFPLGFFLVVALLAFGLRWGFWGRWWGYPGRGGSAPSASEVLRLRFARGEIGAEQFRQMSRELGDDRAR